MRTIEDPLPLVESEQWPGWVQTPTSGLLVALDEEGDLLVMDDRGKPVLSQLSPVEFLEVAMTAAELYVQRFAPTPPRPRRAA